MQKQYIVIGNGSLKHDSTYYEPGQTVLLNEEVAAPLVAMGKLQDAAEATKAPADKEPDGFPDHSLDPQAPETAPETPPAGDQGSATDTTPPAAEGQSDEGNGEQTPPAAPTPEQIAKDMEQVK